jgi:glycogen debranching enzyme
VTTTHTDTAALWQLGKKSIRELEIEHGIMASSREESYGCIFGRDSLITSLALLSYTRRSKNREYLPLVKKVLTNLAMFQGTEKNIESGEEPGKCIHEYRTEGYDHLVSSNEPWYLYEDKTLRNYDTADATLLFLIAFHDYYTLAGDFTFMEDHLPNIAAALLWVSEHGDANGDGLLDYSFHPERKYGGLKTQSWMDSSESVFFEDSGSRPAYPIAPVEVQAYAFAALKHYADFFRGRDPLLSAELSKRATELKAEFNKKFVKQIGRSVAIAYAIDGTGNQLWSARSSMGHVLWASYRGGSVPESIVDDKHVPALVRRLMARDLYVQGAGIRTLSSNSSRFDPVSYHNGSIWPHDSSIIADGFDTFGYIGEARAIRHDLLKAYRHFNTPIELFAYDEGFKEYEGESGGRACRVQAWSAASLLVTLHALGV